MPKELNENAKKWVAALRSGEYAQAQNALKNESGYCCLGILCDLYSKEVGGQWKERNGSSTFLRAFQVLPMEVRDWAGLVGEDGSFNRGGASLAATNDNGATFAEIADIIESQPEGLFV